MKKITLLMIAIMLGTTAWSQCTNGGAYQGVALANSGVFELQSGCNYTGEYSNTTNVIDGDTYTFATEVPTDFITVTSSDGAVVYGFGANPLTLAIDTSADLNDQALRVYYHDDSACATSAVCRDTVVRNDTVAADECPEAINLSAAVTDASADLSWLEAGITAVSYNVEVYATGESAANGDTPVFSDAAVVALTVNVSGLTESTGYDAYITTTCSGATANSTLVGPVTFTTLASCETVSGVSNSNVTGVSADVEWTAGLGNDAFLVEVYADGESAANGDTAVYSNAIATGGLDSVTGLMSDTAYDAYVTGSCGNTATDAVGPSSFTTAPANDDFANASPIVCGGSYGGTTATATLDEDDAPDGFGSDLDAPNVWFTYDGAVEGAGDVTLNLCGSSYDTAVMIYTGTSGNLTLVGGNDDNTAACGQCCQSLATFTADASTLYYITITGYNPGSIGTFDLNVSCVAAAPAPPNDACASAEALTIATMATGTTVGATQNGAEEQPSCDPFGTIADVWYSVEITGGSSTLSVTTTITGTSDQANVAIYSACGGLEADQLACSDGNGGESVDTVVEPGTYYVRVWSDGTAAPPVDEAGRVEGTFTIVADAVLSTGSLDNPSAFTYFPNPVKNTLTLNAQNTIENVVMYNMLGQVVLNATPNAIDSELDMSNLQTGAYFVKVTIENVTKTIRVIKQ